MKARGIHRLTPMKVMKLKTPGLHLDGGGLYLQVTVGAEGNIRRSWLFRYAVPNEKRKSRTGRTFQPTRAMGLGPLHTIGLSEARDKARECRRLLLDGIDPIDNRNRDRGRKLAEDAKAMTLDEAFSRYIATYEVGMTAGNAKQWRGAWRMYVTPTIGALPVSAIEVAHVMQVLEPIWRTVPTTAGRMRGRLEQVLEWSIGMKLRSGPNPAAWKSNLKALLPSIKKVH